MGWGEGRGDTYVMYGGRVHKKSEKKIHTTRCEYVDAFDRAREKRPEKKLSDKTIVNREVDMKRPRERPQPPLTSRRHTVCTQS